MGLLLEGCAPPTTNAGGRTIQSFGTPRAVDQIEAPYPSCASLARSPSIHLIAGGSPAGRVGRERGVREGEARPILFRMRVFSVPVVASALLVGSLVRPDGLRAQFDAFDAGELWLGGLSWVGRQSDVLRPGWRVMAAGTAEVAEGRHLIVEAHYGRFNPRVEGTAVAEAGVRLAGRVQFESRGQWTPHIQARAGLHALLGTSEANGVRQVGLLLGPEVGVAYPIDERLSLLGAVEGAWIWYGDVVGSTLDTDGSGGYALHAGLRVGVRLLLDRRP